MRSITTLTYLNGDVCTQGDGSSVPYRTVIDFTCDREEDEAPSYIGTVRGFYLLVLWFTYCLFCCFLNS